MTPGPTIDASGRHMVNHCSMLSLVFAVMLHKINPWYKISGTEAKELRIA